MDLDCATEKNAVCSSGDRKTPLEQLKERLRAGFLTVEQVKAASRLGHLLSRSLFSNEILVDWADWNKRREFLGSISKTTCVRFAINCAENALPLFEAKYPNVRTPREAIEAAKAWLADPTEENRKAAVAAATAASASASASNVASAAAYAATAAAYAAGANSAVEATTVAAGDAAAAAAGDAAAAWRAAYGAAADALAVEHKRQKAVLAEILLFS